MEKMRITPTSGPPFTAWTRQAIDLAFAYGFFAGLGTAVLIYALVSALTG